MIERLREIWKTFTVDPALPPLPPPPPVGLNREEYIAAQTAYTDKHEKYVKTDVMVAVESFKQTLDYGKLILTYVIWGNAGGLATIIALAPLLRDWNQLWLAQQWLPALLFGIGLFMGACLAVFLVLNFATNTNRRWNIADSNDAWLKSFAFQVDPSWSNAMNEHYRVANERLARRSLTTANWAGGCLIASALAWAAGAILLTIGIISAVPS